MLVGFLMDSVSENLRTPKGPELLERYCWVARAKFFQVLEEAVFGQILDFESRFFFSEKWKKLHDTFKCGI